MQQLDMIVSRLNNKHVGGSVKLYPRAWSEDWFFFLVLQSLVTKAFQDGTNSNRLPSINLLSCIPGGFLMLYTSFLLILALDLLIMQVTTWVFIPSAAFSNFLWVAATKVILFRGHFLINVARSLVVGI